MVSKRKEKKGILGTSGVLPRAKSLKEKASDVINYFLRVKHDGSRFIQFFQIFFFSPHLTVKIVNYPLFATGVRPLHLTSIILTSKKGIPVDQLQETT